jgi:uncharacterized membrane protein
VNYEHTKFVLRENLGFREQIGGLVITAGAVLIALK